MLVVPTQALPNQSLQVQLENQACTINIYQLAYGLFVDLYVNDTLIIAGTTGLDRTRMVRDAYLGFAGDLFFADTQGTADPVYTGLGAQFQLCYLTPADLVELGFTE